MKVFFLIAPAGGHINACARLVNLLRERSVSQYFLELHEEGFSVNDDLQNCISTETLFRRHLLESSTDIGWLDQWLNHFLCWLSQENYKSLKLKIDSLDRILNIHQPDILFVDVFFSYIYFLLPSHQKNIMLLNTQLNSYRDYAIGPLNIALHPYMPRFRLKSRVLWALLNFSKKIFFLHAFWQDPWSLTKKLAREKRIDLSKVIIKDKCFQPGIRGVPELILGYRSFDLPRQFFRVPQYYLGIQFDIHRRMKNEERTIFNHIELLKKEKERCKLIYCCLGTLPDVHSRNIYRFLFLLIEVLRHHPEWFLVISYSGISGGDLSSLPSNVVIYESVPQLQVLPLFDMMITHAGLNSVYECIHAELPMLAFPLNARWDQNGNAARIVYHGLGLMGFINQVRKEQFEKMIYTVLENTKFTENIKDMKRKCISEYEPEKIINLIYQFSESVKINITP